MIRNINAMLVWKYQLRVFITIIILFTLILNEKTYASVSLIYSESSFSLITNSDIDKNSDDKIALLNASLKSMMQRQDYQGSLLLINKILNESEVSNADQNIQAESYYLIGVFYLLTTPVNEALRYLNLCVELKEKNGISDDIYSNALYNMGVLYARLGDYKKHEEYSIRSLNVDIIKFGESSPSLILTYSSLITSYIQQQQYEKAINFANIVLTISANFPDSISPATLSDLYTNMGVCFYRLAEYKKAIIFYEKAELIIKNNNLKSDENYINLLNNMAIAYRANKLPGKSDEYYEKGLTLALYDNSPGSNNLINSYAIILGNREKVEKGKALLNLVLERARVDFGENSHYYIEALKNYAEYLSEYVEDYEESLKYYSICLEYLNNNGHDVNLRNNILMGYSLALAKTGSLPEALMTIQTLIFSKTESGTSSGLFDNPVLAEIIPDKYSLAVFKTKYEIIREMYLSSEDLKVLEAESATAELIISLLEKVRININEEDSRLILGDNYRQSYVNAIADFDLLYRRTSDPRFLKKAFEYSERSKVAGLLSSTRELKATQFHIPDSVANLERTLQRKISLFNDRIYEENNKDVIDISLINNLKDNLLRATRERDSMILVFERSYPDYYAIKYNTKVADIGDIVRIIGRKVNYISYVASENVLYIFIANNRHQQLITMPIDTSFYDNIKTFTKLLFIPSPEGNSKLAFENYQATGYKLYETMIKPVLEYLISGDILISPDNLISYIPFEVLPVSPNSGVSLLYRELPYLMDDFNISYTYSATFLAESSKKVLRFSNTTISFAPDYPDLIDIHSAIMKRQKDMGILRDLPFAREEARSVSDITHGELFLNNAAKESVFKEKSDKYDIIHLAMHTVLNDNDPMNSMLIFSPENDSIEDGFLKTYEIYGIPFKSKMVVLSSCNTGTGFLFSGEGILSLARGFSYSGSQSVVMSMWEVEDKSGMEIIQLFYKNLKRGMSKSVALKKARISYLEKADQLRSHPYFWATLVIYGDNAPLYYPKYIIFGSAVLIMSLLVILIIHLRKRKYS